MQKNKCKRKSHFHFTRCKFRGYEHSHRRTRNIANEKSFKPFRQFQKQIWIHPDLTVIFTKLAAAQDHNCEVISKDRTHFSSVCSSIQLAFVPKCGTLIILIKSSLVLYKGRTERHQVRIEYISVVLICKTSLLSFGWCYSVLVLSHRIFRNQFQPFLFECYLLFLETKQIEDQATCATKHRYLGVNFIPVTQSSEYEAAGDFQRIKKKCFLYDSYIAVNAWQFLVI